MKVAMDSVEVTEGMRVKISEHLGVERAKRAEIKDLLHSWLEEHLDPMDEEYRKQFAEQEKEDIQAKMEELKRRMDELEGDVF